MKKKLEESSADRACVLCFPDTEYALECTVFFLEKDLSTFLGKARLKIKLPCKLTSKDLTQKEHEYTSRHILATRGLTRNQGKP